MSKIFTVEDINSVTAKYYPNNFFTKTIVDIGHTNDFSDAHFNYFTVSRTYDDSTEKYQFNVDVDNGLLLDVGYPFFPFDNNGNKIDIDDSSYNYFQCSSDTPIITIYHILSITGEGVRYYDDSLYVVKDYNPKMSFYNSVFDLEFDMFDLEGDIEGQTFTLNWGDGSASATCQNNKLLFKNILSTGYKLSLEFDGDVIYSTYLDTVPLIPVVDTSLPTLTNGKVNHIVLDAILSHDYYMEQRLIFKCDYPILNKAYDSDNNELSFDVDLRGTTELTNLNIDISCAGNKNREARDWRYPLSQSFKFDVEYNMIENVSDLQLLFVNGGVGRLGADITLNANVTVNKDIYLIGNDCTLDLDGYKIIVPSDKTFKAENTGFTNGENTIQQLTGSIVELTNCTFNDCTGLGSVIDCQVNVGSLDNPNDFTTSLTNCNISNCDMAILHGGDLNVTECTIDGKIGNKEYPYFLYQTDGNAEIIKSNFNISSDTQIEEDIEFNSCIFTCGETAIINGLSREELSTNNINSFLSIPQYNTSTINLTYYYDLIEDYITLTATNGYCHAVSQTDYVFKTNVSIERS